jgi:Zn finger protein HypA/HybF involved in hydrogenase expression
VIPPPDLPEARPTLPTALPKPVRACRCNECRHDWLARMPLWCPSCGGTNVGVVPGGEAA